MPTGFPPYVPDGESVWEFGAGQDYLAKANEEYQRRTANPGSVDRLNCTFVFVTPRGWKRDSPTRIDWAKGRSNERQWREVLVMDALTFSSGLSSAKPWLRILHPK